VVRVEVFVIDTDLLHFMLQKINFDVVFVRKRLVAHRTARYFHKPVVDAVPVKYMETGEHTAVRLVHDCIEANDTFLHEIFAILHSNKGRFDILIGLLWKTALNFEMCSSNSLDQRILRLVVSSASPVHLSVALALILLNLTTRLIIPSIFLIVKHIPHPG